MDEQQKLHPLHDPQWIAEYVKEIGEYPGLRKTGRTTERALRVVAEAIATPHKWIRIQDHTGLSPLHAAQAVIRIVKALKLQHLHMSDPQGYDMWLYFSRDKPLGWTRIYDGE